MSTEITDVDAATRTGKMKGELIIHGIERPVVLDVAYLGEATDPWGNTSAAFMAEVTVNRKDFELTWNQALETGGMLVATRWRSGSTLPPCPRKDMEARAAGRIAARAADEVQEARMTGNRKEE